MKISEDIKLSVERLKKLDEDSREIEGKIYKEQETLMNLSPLQIGDKVRFSNNEPSGVFFVLNVCLSYSNRLNYTLSKPIKNGTMSEQTAGFWSVGLEELELIEKAKPQEKE